MSPARAKKRDIRSPAPARATAPGRGRLALTFAALVAITLVAFSNAGDAGFLSFDDPDYITANPHVSAGVTPSGARWALASTDAANWHPMTRLSHMLDVQLFGMNAGAHHQVSVVIHVLTALLLCWLLVRVTGDLWPSALVAALFAVHPLHVESVMWLSERKDVLSACLWMLTLVAYVEYVRRPAPVRYLLVVVTFAIGLMAKPMLVTLPVVLLLLDFWPLRRTTTVKTLLIEKLPLVGLAVAAGLVTLVAQQAAGAMHPIDRLPLTDRVTNALVAYATYVEKTFWPEPLVAFYPYAKVSLAAATAAALKVLALSVAAISLARRCPYLAVGWFWFVITLAPVSGLVQVGNQAMADRYTYIPLVGLFIATAWGLRDLAARWQPGRHIFPALALVVVVACVVATRAQARVWTNDLTLWQHAVDSMPDNYYAHGALGAALVGHGRLQDARRHLLEALRLKPDDADAHNDLGQLLASSGQIDDAIAHFTAAIRANPRFAEAHHNLGVALASQNKRPEAIAEFREALRLSTNLVKTRNALGRALATDGRLTEAAEQFAEAIRLEPNSAAAHFNLGLTFANQGRVAEAIPHLERAVRLDPGFAPAQNLLKKLR